MMDSNKVLANRTFTLLTKQATSYPVFLAEDNQSGSIYVQGRMSFACLVMAE